MPKLTVRERKALLEVAQSVGEMCEKNKETKEDTERIVAYCLYESTNALTEYKNKRITKS